MSAATAAAIGLATYPVAAAFYLAASSARIRWQLHVDVSRVLLGRHVSGRPEEAGRPTPHGLSVSAGVEPPSAVQAPPAPCHLVGAARPQPAAPARPPRVLVMDRPAGAYTACGSQWGGGCWFHPSGMHSCVWPASACVGAHKCGCGAGKNE